VGADAAGLAADDAFGSVEQDGVGVIRAVDVDVSAGHGEG
jgi:hypothetical protein